MTTRPRSDGEQPGDQADDAGAREPERRRSPAARGQPAGRPGEREPVIAGGSISVT